MTVSHFGLSYARPLAFAALGLCSLAPLAHAQTADDTLALDRRIISTEKEGSDVMPNLEYLSDMIGPRLTGSANLRRANDWTAEKMRQYGLENVHLEAYTIPVGWQRGTVEAQLITPTTAPIHAVQMAWTNPTHGRISGSIVIFAPDSEADFAAYKGKLKGAIILTAKESKAPTPSGAMGWPEAKPLPPIKAFAPADAPKPEEKKEDKPDEKARAAEMIKFMALRKKVAAFLAEEGPAAVIRDSGKPHGLFNMTGSWDKTWGSSFPTVFVEHEDVAMLQRLLKRGVPVRMTLNVKSKFVPGPITVYNTVGEIKGSEKPDEIVLLGAHLDSWDLGQGSTDNGTGSMAVLEAARLIKSLGITPKRTVKFALFSGEEQGLNGSKAYVEAHKSEMPNYDVVFVHDTGTGRVKGLWLQNRDDDKPALAKEFANLNDLGLLTDEPSLLPGKMNGTDHASFDDAGVPAFAFNQDAAEYGLTHHSQSDTFDKVRADDLKQGACVLAILAVNAAQSPERYPRKAAAVAKTP